MSTNFPRSPSASAASNNLFASVDMGTSSFKLLIVRVDPSSGRFLTLDRLKEPVLLGLDASTTISHASELRATAALHKFQRIIHSHSVFSSHSRVVATSAVREASNQSTFIRTIHETLGLEVEVLSGIEEARLIYLGVLQFHPVHDLTVLTVDIGGGSTEFAIGKKGEILYADSLNLGHVTLTKKFTDIEKMREHIRSTIEKSGLREKMKDYDIDVVIGSSGTVKAIGKAVFHGYARKLEPFEEYRRDWRFSKEELRELVDKLSEEEREMVGKLRREGFFKKRSEFIVAGSVLLEEIFNCIGIREMDVSSYALGEGVIAEKLGQVYEGYNLKANARWRSVLRLAMRFNNKKRMKSAASCASIAKVLFEGIKRCGEFCEGQNNLDISLDDKDLEYVEAACLLHNIGLYIDKKGYHKQSYQIIKNGGHLLGYDDEEVKLIALLVRYHRKKFPKCNCSSFEGLTEEVLQKFNSLCTVLRVSIAIQQHQPLDIKDLEFSHCNGGFKLVFEARIQHPTIGSVQSSVDDVEGKLHKELEHFRKVFQRKLSIVIPPSTSECSGSLQKEER